jgi:uncharacterized membrane protein YdjX (TVP38/TMEM64 family)
MINIKESNKIKFVIFIVTVILFMVIGRYFPLDLDKLQRPLTNLPFFWAGIVFIILYVIVTFFICFSKDVFRIVAAVLFGPLLSSLLVFIAELINAVILFNFSRFLGRGFVEESLKPKFQNLDERLAKANFLWLFLLRVTPLIPFRFMDIAAGLTKMSFKRYLMVVILGSPLRIYWLQYILAAVGRNIFTSPEVIANYLILNRPAFIFTLIYLALVILVFFKLKRKAS